MTRTAPSCILAAALACGFAAAIGCAGAGKTTPTGGGGSSGPGTAGTTGNAGTSGSAGTTGGAGSSGPGSAGSIGPGTAGTTGAAGTGTPGAAGVTGGGRGGGAAGSVGTTGSAGTTGAGGTNVSGAAGVTGSGGAAGICQSAQYTFEPKIPTVYLLVDRSGSMFHCLTGDTNAVVCATPANTAWSTFKEAVRSVVGPLDTKVRLGFATIWGTNPGGGGTCPSLQGMLTDSVPPALNNANPIMAKYDSLAFPPNNSGTGVKFESPASESIQAVTQALMAITAPGDKYIIFVTDGQPDYCDDANSLCAPDSVIARLQVAKAAGIKTIVLGVQTAAFDLAPGILQAYANAGAGESTVAPLRTGGSAEQLWNECNVVAGWQADRVALGRSAASPTLLGTYATTAGPTMPYMPSATSQTMLVTQLSQALANVKSCTFDLSDVGGKSIKVDTTKLNQAHVKIEGAEVMLSATNGWNVDAAMPTQLVLSGTACATWRMPNNNNIDFQFPCGSIIFE